MNNLDSIVNNINERKIVEEFWISFLIHADQDHKKSIEIVNEFEEKIEFLASTLPENYSKKLLKNIDDERQKLFDEYNENPALLKKRLKINMRKAIYRNTGNILTIKNCIITTIVASIITYIIKHIF